MERITAILPASESLMPKGLLDRLNEREVLDLVAYTPARGGRGDPRFRKQQQTGPMMAIGGICLFAPASE